MGSRGRNRRSRLPFQGSDEDRQPVLPLEPASAVGESALETGADLINDISGLRDNEPLAELAASKGVPIVLMHLRGTTQTMQDNPCYEDTIGEIVAELREAIGRARRGGIEPERIIVDPGIGFGKRVEDNLRIIRWLKSFESLGLPLLIGLSRKSFIGATLNAEFARIPTSLCR